MTPDMVVVLLIDVISIGCLVSLIGDGIGESKWHQEKETQHRQEFFKQSTKPSSRI
jgi:hypothetical protein